ncbi:hypothetical protein [Luteolibacter sp. AS25]|uniref:hypothetical protein n=1 Tax=Luteolibacter sp. AS25 TaxID=3135776 RepID=UPI00398B033A
MKRKRLDEFTNKKRVDPSKFDPVICSTFINEWVHFLVCKKRLATWKKLGEADTPKTPLFPPDSEVYNHSVAFGEVVFPAAILLTEPASVLYGMLSRKEDEEREWFVRPTSSEKIGDTVARAALAEAYRGVINLNLNFPENDHLAMKFLGPVLCISLKDKLKSHQLTTLRNVTIWVCWDHWNRLGLSEIDRAKILSRSGFICTPTALRRVREGVLG